MIVAEDIQGRMDIKGHQDVTNMLSGADFYQSVAHTCEQIYILLAEHCGPQATDALIIQDNDARNLKDHYYSIFTKDGINIVRSVQFISPIQKHVQDLVAYIGDRVDSLSHDGTTTAMMFFTGLVKVYFHNLALMLKSGVRPDYRKIKTKLITEITDLSNIIEHVTITVDRFATDHNLSQKDALCMIAYWQAMISSKGDRELAEAIMEVVETLPKELYGLFTISQSGMETDKRFTVLHDEYDFMVPVIVNIDEMNHRMGTEFLSEDCDLILSEDDLIRGNPALEVINAHVEAAKQGSLTRDLVIVTKTIDSTLQAQITAYNRANRFKIIVFTMSIHNPYSSRCTVLSAMMAVAGVYSLQDHVIDTNMPYLIHDAKVHYHNKRLYVSHLYQKDGSQYHPFYNNPEAFTPYTLMVEALRTALEEFTSGRRRVESAADKARFEDFVEIYRRMISANVRNLQISGMRHDVLADRDVLQDAFGAVLSSLENGFVFDGYLKMYTYLYYHPDPNNTIEAISNTVYDILKMVHKTDDSSVFYYETETNSLKILNYLQTLFFHKDNDAQASVFEERIGMSRGADDDMIYLHYPIDSDPIFKLNIDTNWKQQQIPLIQPADTYRELFKRVVDLLPKLINTSRAIIPGTVNSETRS